MTVAQPQTGHCRPRSYSRYHGRSSASLRLGRSLGSFVLIAAVMLCGLIPAVSDADIKPDGRMLRYPDVSQTHIAFLYANNLWLVPREGGIASPLTTVEGQELFPRFSADNQTIAFVGNYQGGRDLYTIPVTGGIPQRITHHPALEILCDWTPSGELLFSTNAFAGLQRLQELYTVSDKQPLPQKLPVVYGSNGAISPDGVYLAFTPYNADTRTWKRYRGGMASDIWLFDLSKKTAQRITDFEGTDTLPMWHGQTVYYLSDAGQEHRLNIWSYDTATGARRQVTQLSQYDVKWPSIGPGDHGQGEIVFQYGADLYLLDLETSQSRQVAVTIPGDRPLIMPQEVNVAGQISGADIAPQGQRVVAEARGDLWSLPAKDGSPRNMTRSSGVAERSPSWSPDGKWIAYFSDLTGEYELYIKQSDGKGETRRLTNDGRVFRYNPVWSPDSKHLLFTDKTGAIYLHTMEGSKTGQVDIDPWAGRPTLSWSHDSSWIAYDKRSDDRVGTSSIWLYEVASGQKHQVTDNLFNDSSPTFDRKGEYLYFTSNRRFGSPLYEDLGTTFIYGNTSVLVAMPLRAEVKNPLLPKSDEVPIEEKKEPPAGDKKPGDAKDAAPEKPHEAAPPKEEPKKEEPKKEEPPKEEPQKEEPEKKEPEKKEEPPQGEPEKKEGEPSPQPAPGETPPPQDNPQKPADGKPADEKPADEKPAPEQAKPEGAPVAEQAAKPEPGKEEAKKEAESKTLKIELEGILQRCFQIPVRSGVLENLSVNFRGQVIYARHGVRGSDEKPAIMSVDISSGSVNEAPILEGAMGYGISADGKKLLVMLGRQLAIIDAAPGQKPTPVSTNGMSVVIQPREEWQQVFTDAWRIERDFFYDPHMHGVDWPAVREQYQRMLADCASRDDVGFVISEMIAELNVGHAYYRAGDGEPTARVGLLGCDFARTDGAYQIAKFCEGAPWDLDARNPLREAGVKEGEYLLAVNRVPLEVQQDPWAQLQGLAGETVVLTVSGKPQSGADDRDVVVKLLPSEAGLRFRQWIERNRKYVEDRSEGQVGYIYVPDTGTNGQDELFRQFSSQMNKAALIIDDRWNGGGQIPTRFIELLNRPVTNYWARRDGHDMTWPPDAHQGPKCMLINGLAGSGGDMFPALFRQAGIGKLIGMRTWGGLVGISGNPGMIDGSSVTAPTFAYYEKDGTWGIEGHGVDPDIEVVDDPAKLAQGSDPQLDAAIALMLDEIKQHPYAAPARPPYADRKGFGIRPEDK